MENDFHLSIKNHQRKIGDVRDLFRNLTNDEKQSLEKEKVLSENKTNSLRKQRLELENQQQQQHELHNQQQQQYIRREERSHSQHQNQRSRHYNKNPNRYIEHRMSDVERNTNNRDIANYEEKVIKAYDRLNREASEDFGKYLDDDEDFDDTDYNNRHKETTPKATPLKNTQQKTDDSNSGGDEPSSGRKRISKKLRKLSKKGEKGQQQAPEPHLTDMCGFYQVELPPKEKERLEKLRQEQAKGGLAGLKNKIKNLFTIDNDYAIPHYQNNYHYADNGEGGPGVGDPYFAPRTIQAVEYNRSKIGYQQGQDYQEYYHQVDDLRRFDEEARINNFKIRPNDNVAIMDDEFNLKYTKSHKFKDSNKNAANTDDELQNGGNAKKPNKFNKLTGAILSKAKSFRT